ncbi:hypothetical protein D4R20_00355 [bacterium]|nr:MAG: hypothetical protein D4R20_00355 [bacterium]
MKKITLVLFIISFLSGISMAQTDFSKPVLFKEKTSIMESKIDRDLRNAQKEYASKSGKMLDFYVDFQLGVGSTTPNVTSAPGVGDYQTQSKLGYTTGALFYISLFDALKFSTGLTLNGRSFQITTPSVIPPALDTTKKSISSYVAANYLDIPLNFNIGGMLSEKLGLWFNGGPYLGILISSPDKNSQSTGYKNFDFGLMGTLTGNYVFAYPLSVILGTNFKYGGLNNLGSTSMVDKITTTNYTVFTGLRFAL